MSQHPSLKTLQDYFSGEAEVEKLPRLKKHLAECDECSKILSEMAKVDILFSHSKKVLVSKKTKTEIMKKADMFFTEIEQTKAATLAKKEKQKEQVDLMVRFLREWREGALSELKMPIMQATSLAILVVVATQMARTTTMIENYKIVNDEVEITYSELEGDLDEDI